MLSLFLNFPKEGKIEKYIVTKLNKVNSTKSHKQKFI